MHLELEVTYTQWNHWGLLDPPVHGAGRERPGAGVMLLSFSSASGTSDSAGGQPPQRAKQAVLCLLPKMDDASRLSVLGSRSSRRR